MAGKLIVRIFFYGLMGIDPGNGDEGTVYLLDATSQDLKEHVPLLAYCAGDDCCSPEFLKISDEELQFTWTPRPGKRPELNFERPLTYGEELGMNQGLPETPKGAADFRWVIDLREALDGGTLRKCLDERRRSPCGTVVATVHLDHGQLSTCQLVRYKIGKCHWTAKLAIREDLTRAAANVVLLEMKQDLDRVESVGISARRFGSTYNFPISRLDRLPQMKCPNGNQDDRCVYVFIANQPKEEEGYSRLAKHFPAFRSFVTRIGSTPGLIPQACKGNNVQPNCNFGLQDLFPVKKALDPEFTERFGFFARINNLGNRSICPLVRD